MRHLEGFDDSAFWDRIICFLGQDCYDVIGSTEFMVSLDIIISTSQECFGYAVVTWCHLSLTCKDLILHFYVAPTP